MEQIKFGEANSEILIFLEKHFPTRLSALEEATRVLQREVIREKQKPVHWGEL